MLLRGEDYGYFIWRRAVVACSRSALASGGEGNSYFLLRRDAVAACSPEQMSWW